MSRICTICARGGSQGVADKNLRPLLDRPLIAHSIVQAKECGLFDSVAVSSDSQAILDAAAAWGADHLVVRPHEMATSEAAKPPAIKHCLTEAERYFGRTFDVLVDLDATSPLRSLDDIRGAVALLEARNVASVITGATARRSPYFNLVERDENGVVSLSKTPAGGAVLRRQDAPECFDMNASIYVWRRDAFIARPLVFHDDTLLFEMPEERSVDIDSTLDFEIVEMLMTKKSGTVR